MIVGQAGAGRVVEMSWNRNRAGIQWNVGTINVRICAPIPLSLFGVVELVGLCYTWGKHGSNITCADVFPLGILTGPPE